ncbi:Uncharacterised protein [Mycobacteroides abscessus subsp. abscessus]|nr:Uncharacterised protein [Mycobacteroides abscessus subsp. abscessus]
MAMLSRIFSITSLSPLAASVEIWAPSANCRVRPAIFSVEAIMSPMRAAMVSISATRSFKKPRF